MKSTRTRAIDGPASPAFSPVSIETRLTGCPDETRFKKEFVDAFADSPSGDSVCQGIAFTVGDPVIIGTDPVEIPVNRNAGWLAFMHTVDRSDLRYDDRGFVTPPMRGEGNLGTVAGRYSFIYESGDEVEVPIRRRHQIGSYRRRWGENCFEAVAHRKPHETAAHHEQMGRSWGHSQTRTTSADMGSWINWIWAWENPRPDEKIVKIRAIAEDSNAADSNGDDTPILLFAISAGEASGNPLRWERRAKCLLHLPGEFNSTLAEGGIYSQIGIDLGQIISARPQAQYEHETWESSRANLAPKAATSSVIVEYTAHADAAFYLENAVRIPVDGLPGIGRADAIRIESIPPAHRRVTLKVVEKGSTTPVPVKLHIHGEAGEYLAPVDRHRIPNPSWFEDYSVDMVHDQTHLSSYITGVTTIDLPIGRVYIEVTRGFEIRPVRRVIETDKDTDTITIEIERALDWRARGWVTADTHVHFLSPMSALLEGSAEGVNVVNLLASQWGELQTNVGDFDGRNTWGSRETNGDGEYLVRVGTENRQHVMGHISLLGYEGNIIAPMTTGGPDESALGDPVEILLTEWARRCHEQGGIVVIPHFPNPRAENAATIVAGEADGIEMTSWGDHYSGINPYSLSDWYRYLNCGFQVAAVGGTDKMSAYTAIGTVRTYAKTDVDQMFDYDAWMSAVRRGETFVSYGPLIEFAVDGKPAGERLAMSKKGGTVDVTWELASVTVPMTRVELIVNGEIRESVEVAADHAAGTWSVEIDKSSWIAILVRGAYRDKPEMIAAHTSTVMIDLDGSKFSSAADEITILEQIEGAMAFLDTIGTRAETVRYKQMRLVLESAHRTIHNRMHHAGHYHDHSPQEHHEEHDR